MSRLKHNATANLQAFGQSGFRYLTAGQFTEDATVAITALEDTTVTTATAVGDALTSIVIPAGVTVYGAFSRVDVVAGRAVAYLTVVG